MDLLSEILASGILDPSPPPVVSEAGRRRLRLERPVEETEARTGPSWVREVFPGKASFEFGPHQLRLWDHAARITPGHCDIPPYEAIWPRGAGKTTTVELIVLWLLATQARKYIVICCSTLDKARDRIAAIRAGLESPEFRRRYPTVGEPAVNDRNIARSWNNRLLITESNQVVQAVSLRSDNRGMNQGMEDLNIRPDMLIFDDIDKQTDLMAATIGKEQRISKELLPIGGSDGLVWFAIQNLITDTGVFARLMRNEGPFGHDRILDGPIPAIENLSYESYVVDMATADGNVVPVTRHRITGGTATWVGQDLAACQARIDDMGIQTFLHEMQHQMEDFEGALLRSEHFQYAPDSFDPRKLGRKVVAVDPSGGAVENGIACVGMTTGKVDGKAVRIFYVVDDATVGPNEGYEEPAVRLAAKHRCAIVVEGNYGGDATVRALESAIADLLRRKVIKYRPQVHKVTAVNSKRDRALPMVRAYKEGRVFHAGHFHRLQTEWTTWIPGETGDKSPNRLDAVVHAFNWLDSGRGGVSAGLAGTDSFLS